MPSMNDQQRAAQTAKAMWDRATARNQDHITDIEHGIIRDIVKRKKEGAETIKSGLGPKLGSGKAQQLGLPSTGMIKPVHSQGQYSPAQQPITTRNDTVEPVAHHVKAVFIFLGCLAITIVLGLFIGSMSDSKFNLANAAGVWGGGLYITYEITKWMWRKHDG